MRIYSDDEITMSIDNESINVIRNNTEEKVSRISLYSASYNDDTDFKLNRSEIDKLFNVLLIQNKWTVIIDSLKRNLSMPNYLLLK